MKQKVTEGNWTSMWNMMLIDAKLQQGEDNKSDCNSYTEVRDESVLVPKWMWHGH